MEKRFGVSEMQQISIDSREKYDNICVTWMKCKKIGIGLGSKA